MTTKRLRELCRPDRTAVAHSRRGAKRAQYFGLIVSIHGLGALHDALGSAGRAVGERRVALEDG